MSAQCREIISTAWAPALRNLESSSWCRDARAAVAQGALVDAQVLGHCAIGLPVSRTSRTAPSLKSLSNLLRVSSSERSSPLRATVPSGVITSARKSGGGVRRRNWLGPGDCCGAAAAGTGGLRDDGAGCP